IIKLSKNHSPVSKCGLKAFNQRRRTTPCCQVDAAKLFGRTNSEERRVGGAAVDGGRYTHGLKMSQHSLSKKIHTSQNVRIPLSKSSI
ncbi:MULTISPECIES: hypothetical protein, partial [unclassified Labrenzia]